MMNVNQPKPIFRSSSYAPTRGTNKPNGYIQREVKLNANKQGPFGGVSKFGSTGRSETRSGLARSALQRSAGMKAPQSGPVSSIFRNQASEDPRLLARLKLMRLLQMRNGVR